MRKMKKIFVISILAIILIFLLGNVYVYADDWYEEQQEQQEGLDDPTLNPNAWKPNEEEEPVLFEKAGVLLGTINVIGVVCSVIVLIIIGIKYMFGSIEEKAEYKKTIWTYILGMFFIIAATTIPNIMYNIVSGLF